jgi:hypothetical protein
MNVYIKFNHLVNHSDQSSLFLSSTLSPSHGSFKFNKILRGIPSLFGIECSSIINDPNDPNVPVILSHYGINLLFAKSII